MSRRKNPETSHDAYESMKGKPISEHHSRIIAALDELKEAIYERIAMHCDMEKNQVSRRLKELEDLGIVEKTGNTSPTTSGRKANIYKLKTPAKKEQQKDVFAFQPSLFPITFHDNTTER